VSASVSFETGDWQWLAERKGVLFIGETGMGPVEFLIRIEALAELFDPDVDAIDRETAIETFVKHEAGIHRIAHREFVSRLGGAPPILLTVSDVAE
jgi:hypothetical protein